MKYEETLQLWQDVEPTIIKSVWNSSLHNAYMKFAEMRLTYLRNNEFDKFELITDMMADLEQEMQ